MTSFHQSEMRTSEMLQRVSNILRDTADSANQLDSVIRQLGTISDSTRDISNNLTSSINQTSDNIKSQASSIKQEINALENMGLAIKDVNASSNILGSSFIGDYLEVKKYIEDLYTGELSKKEIIFRNILSYKVIPYSIYEENKAIINENEAILKSNNNLEHVKAREQINYFVLSIAPYEFSKKDIDRIIEVDMIYILKSDRKYSFDYGFGYE
jgi:uncharacterized protein YoxC